MTRFEHALLMSVMSTTIAMGGCTADVQTDGLDEPILENAEDVEQATDDAMNRWGMDDLDKEDEEPLADDEKDDPCKHGDEPECRDGHDKPDVDCKDPRHECDPRCDRERKHKACIFKSILIERKKRDKGKALAIGAALFKYDTKSRTIDYLLYVLNEHDVVSAELFLGEKGKPVAILAHSSQLELSIFPGLLLGGTIKSDDLKGALKGESIDILADAMKSGDIYLSVASDRKKDKHDKRKDEVRGHVKLLKCKVIRKHGHDGKDDHHACKPDHCKDTKHEDCKHDRGDGKHDDCKDPKDHHCRKDCKGPKDHHCHKDCEDDRHSRCEKDCKDDRGEHGDYGAVDEGSEKLNAE